MVTQAATLDYSTLGQPLIVPRAAIRNTRDRSLSQAVEQDPCPEIPNVKDEELGHDPFPTAVSYIDSNSEEDVIMARCDAPPSTFPESAAAPLQTAAIY